MRVVASDKTRESCRNRGLRLTMLTTGQLHFGTRLTPRQFGACLLGMALNSSKLEYHGVSIVGPSHSQLPLGSEERGLVSTSLERQSSARFLILFWVRKPPRVSTSSLAFISSAILGSCHYLLKVLYLSINPPDSLPKDDPAGFNSHMRQPGISPCYRLRRKNQGASSISYSPIYPIIYI